MLRSKTGACVTLVALQDGAALARRIQETALAKTAGDDQEELVQRVEAVVAREVCIARATPQRTIQI